MTKKKLTPLQERFAQELVLREVEGRTGWKSAALAAARKFVGSRDAVSEKTLGEKASRMAKHPAVVERCEQLRNRVATKKLSEILPAAPRAETAHEALTLITFDTTTERILQELARVGLSDPGGLFDDAGNLLPIHELPEHLRRAISSVKVTRTRRGKGDDAADETDTEVKFWPKVEALRLMGTYRRMFVSLKEVGKAGEFDHMTTEELRAEVAKYDGLRLVAQGGKAAAAGGGR